MTFNSFPFLIFFPIVLGLFHLTRIPLFKGRVGANMRMYLLLITSYFFYMYEEPKLLVLILFTTLVSYVCGLVIEQCRAKSDAPDATEECKRKMAWACKLCLTLTLITSLGILFVFKYLNFIVGLIFGAVNAIADTSLSASFSLLLPVGISFYTFQTLSYAIDVYRGSIRAERNLPYYALVVSFFPQLVAGPIERPENLLPQLKQVPTVTREDWWRGGYKMLLGFFKKIVVADLISSYVNAVYNGIEEQTIPALSIVFATVLFAVQIYCDFSGYTDIATGCARMMGIRLMKNFDHPYRSSSIKEFWGRWHISLSSWFKDYLYFPLGGSRCAKWKHMRNLLIVFLISGLWHGAAVNFVLWGVLHGVYQVVGNLTLPARNRLWEKIGVRKDDRGLRIARTVGTFILVDFAWLFFRANSTSDLGRLLSSLVSPASWSFSLSEALTYMGFTPAALILTALTFVILCFFDSMVRHHDEPDGEGVLLRRGTAVVLCWIVLFAWYFLCENDLTSTFIYFQF